VVFPIRIPKSKGCRPKGMNVHMKQIMSGLGVHIRQITRAFAKTDMYHAGYYSQLPAP